MSTLFQPYTLRSLTIPNRAWMAPMCQYSADADGPLLGAPNDWHLAHLGARAVGGAGLILVEATAVSPEGRITPTDLGLWNDEQRDAFKRVTRLLEAQGTVPGIQISHAGRKGSTTAPWEGGAQRSEDEGGWRTVGPSPLPARDGDLAPREMTKEEIKGVVADFAKTAERALDAGFKVVEIHGAHGYLVGSFLSSHSNQRTDEYGG
ncbi:NADH:flavin oxidoreductase/NADH oxidase, partial [Streptomyces sp. NPDC057654]